MTEYIIVAFVVAIVAILVYEAVGSRTSFGDALRRGLGIYPPPPVVEPKVFGLEQAMASVQYLKDVGPQGAKVLMAVLMGALGYTNTVSTDVGVEVNQHRRFQQKNLEKMKANEDMMASLASMNAGLRSSNNHADGVVAELEKIAAMFGG